MTKKQKKLQYKDYEEKKEQVLGAAGWFVGYSKRTRPCQRCIKRDLAGSCTDGVRKKAKYLQDAVDSQQQAAETESQTGSVEAQSTIPLTSTANSNLLTSSTTSTILDHGFGSDAINLEYSILSTMLSSPTAELQSIASGFSMVDTWQRQDALEAMANTLQQQQQHQGHLQRSVLAQQQQQQQQLQQPLLLKNNTGKSIFGQSDTLQAANGSMKGTKRKFPSNTPEN
ncbi:Transcriptional regulator of nonfermentable carbon utilization, partial [Lobosporangium transversale]